MSPHNATPSAKLTCAEIVVPDCTGELQSLQHPRGCPARAETIDDNSLSQWLRTSTSSPAQSGGVRVQARSSRGASISHAQELQGGQRTTQETNGYRSQVSWGRCGAIGEKVVPHPWRCQAQFQLARASHMPSGPGDMAKVPGMYHPESHPNLQARGGTPQRSGGPELQVWVTGGRGTRGVIRTPATTPT